MTAPKNSIGLRTPASLVTRTGCLQRDPVNHKLHFKVKHEMSKLPDKVAAGGEIDVQLAPLGDWAQTVGGKRVTQRFDEEALAEVVRNFRGEILVDADHRSTKPDGDTSAYAWVTALKADPAQGLVGTMRFTDKGAAAVNAREYRFVSVSWYLGSDGRPRELDSVALTNRPNLPVRPVVNREGGETQAAGGGETTAADGGETKGKPEMEELKTLLGLAADATDDQVVAAAKALKERLDTTEAQAKDAEAERFAAENSAKCDAATLKDAYLKSPDVAKALVANMKAQAPAPALPDFSKGRAPAPVSNAAAPGKGSDPAEAYKHYAAMPEGPEKEAYLASNAQAISDGYEAVRNAR